MIRILVLISISFLIACSAKLVAPTQMDADRAAQAWPGTSLAELNEGKALYEANCGKCHGLKRPGSESVEEWNKIVPVMAKKAKVDDATEKKILKYVVTMSHAK